MRFLILIFAVLASLNQMPLSAQPDLYSFPEVDDAKPKKEEPKPIEPFILTLAKKTGMPADVLSEASLKGFGRLELIRLILISKKSGKPLPDLILQREKSARFAKIAEEAKVDNNAIKKEAAVMLKELEKDPDTAKSQVKKSTPTAGTENPDKTLK